MPLATLGPLLLELREGPVEQRLGPLGLGREDGLLLHLDHL